MPNIPASTILSPEFQRMKEDGFRTPTTFENIIAFKITGLVAKGKRLHVSLPGLEIKI